MSVIFPNSDYEPTKWTEEEKRKNLGTHERLGTFLIFAIIVVFSIILALIY